MYIEKQKKALILAVCTMLVFTSSLFAKPKVTPENVKQEEGYYYGYGKADTYEEAVSLAKVDLVASALTTELRLINPRAPFVKVTPEAAAARFDKINPFVESEKEETPSVLFRIKDKDWKKLESKYREDFRNEIAFVNTLSLDGCLKVLGMLGENGLYDLVTANEHKEGLLSKVLEDQLVKVAGEYVFEISVPDGLVTGDEEFVVTVKDENGKPVQGLTLSVLWTGNEVEATAENKTDVAGNVVCTFPKQAGYTDCPVTLLVATNFSKAYKGSRVLRNLDAKLGVDGNYAFIDNFDKLFPIVTVPEGEFTAGALSHDRRASKREVQHVVNTPEYGMFVNPITNGQYKLYLHTTRSEKEPEYFVNPAYNDDKQPVVGITYDDAVAYAEWLSEETGKSFRLPTEEEWEKAARAGKEIIYPWGDENPKDGKRANYKGNGKVKGPSTIGTFESSKNEWGISDMSGNVWELTSTSRQDLAEGEEPTKMVAKGGSWMDGPIDLRISNYREIEKTSMGPDIGFRLVLEKGASNEE